LDGDDRGLFEGTIPLFEGTIPLFEGTIPLFNGQAGEIHEKSQSERTTSGGDWNRLPHENILNPLSFHHLARFKMKTGSVGKVTDCARNDRGSILLDAPSSPWGPSSLVSNGTGRHFAEIKQ
jgi:hypothetical protein